MPSMTYGVEANGFSLAQRAFARRIAFSAHPGAAGGHSITCALALANDPAISIDTAVLIALSEMLWTGCCLASFNRAWSRCILNFPPPLSTRPRSVRLFNSGAGGMEAWSLPWVFYM